MLSKGLENTARILVAATAASLICSSALQADDTEIYQATPTAVNSRPQVLIIFDDSGSMNDVVADSPVCNGFQGDVWANSLIRSDNISRTTGAVYGGMQDHDGVR